MNLKKHLILLSLCFSFVTQSKAFGGADSLQYRFYFPVGKSELSLSYRNNGKVLDSLIADFHTMREKFMLSGIRLYSGASPEGGMALNKRLSHGRLESLQRTLQAHIPVADSVFKHHFLAEDWNGLLSLIEKSDMPYKEEAVQIIRHTPIWVIKKGIVVDSRKRQLMNLRGGKVWHYMSQHFFSELRSASVVVCDLTPLSGGAGTSTVSSRYPAQVRDTIVIRDTIERNVVIRDTVWIPISRTKPFYMGLRTNLLYDALLVPNIGVEFYLGKRWSIGGNWVYAWWKNDQKHKYWRIYGGEIALRKYFGAKAMEKPLSGHHIGLYGQLFTYDFECGEKGVMGGKPGGSLWDKANYGVGIEYGYSLAIAKNLNLDFSIGCGYIGGTYYEYKPIDDHYVWQATKKRSWFGPTKAEISLVWLLGRGNQNKMKGGKQ